MGLPTECAGLVSLWTPVAGRVKDAWAPGLSTQVLLQK